MRSGEQGQATVEAVLVLSVLVALALVVVQVGVVVRDRVLLAHAGREAARAAAVDPTLATATASARAATGLDDGRLTVALSGSGASPAPGDRLTVVVGYRAPTTVPLVGALIPDIDLETSATTRVE
jgi:Flp pilus assembly protein TadG